MCHTTGSYKSVLVLWLKQEGPELRLGLLRIWFMMEASVPVILAQMDAHFPVVLHIDRIVSNCSRKGWSLDLNPKGTKYWDLLCEQKLKTVFSTQGWTLLQWEKLKLRLSPFGISCGTEIINPVRQAEFSRLWDTGESPYWFICMLLWPGI